MRSLRLLAALWLAATLGLMPFLGGCGRYGPPVRPVSAGQTPATDAAPEPGRSVFGDDYRDEEPVPYILEGLAGDETDLEVEPEPDPTPAEPEAEPEANPSKDAEEATQSSE